jgi:hypothetical protein
MRDEKMSWEERTEDSGIREGLRAQEQGPRAKGRRIEGFKESDI